MAKSEALWRDSFTRRKALASLAGLLAGASTTSAQQDPFRDHSRVPGMAELRNAFDFEAVAYERLDRATYNYTARGSGSEFTVRRNRAAFDWVELVPKSVAEPGYVETSSDVLGAPLRFPIMVAPSAAHTALHPAGEAATYQGCTQAAETPMIVSYVSSMPFAEIARANGAPLWFQLYPREQLQQNREPLAAVQNAGCGAVVVTIDQKAAYYDRPLHDRNLSLRPRRPPRRTGNAARYRFSSLRLWYEWKLFEGLRTMVQVPMLAKGILTAEDALLAIEHGLDGIVVSNHGGRTLDYVPSSLEVLPEIVEAVGGRIPVLVDSGFRRGSDILKALALGASAVCLGRAPRWGLGSFGAPGVARVLEIMQSELRTAMTRCGTSSLASIDRSLVRTNLP